MYLMFQMFSSPPNWAEIFWKLDGDKFCVAMVHHWQDMGGPDWHDMEIKTKQINKTVSIKKKSEK